MWNGSGNAVWNTTLRYFTTRSRARAPNLSKINPRVPFEEAAYIAEGLYGVIKSHGPLSIGNAWNHAKEASISGLESKTHMKIMLKWMRGKRMLKQICNQVGSNKKFLVSTLPDEPQGDQANNSTELNAETVKPYTKKQSQNTQKCPKATKKRTR